MKNPIIEAQMRLPVRQTGAEYGAEISERQFKEQVLTLAGYLGWRLYHTFDSRKSQSGYPDLCLVRDGRLIYAELKTDTGKLTPDQVGWLNELGRVPNVETFIWRPSDLELIRTILAR